MKRRTRTTPAFKRAARKQMKKGPIAKAELEVAIMRIHDDAFDPRLKTHKLKGNLLGTYAATVAPDVRILFKLAKEGDEEIVVLITVGTHDDVY